MVASYRKLLPLQYTFWFIHPACDWCVEQSTNTADCRSTLHLNVSMMCSNLFTNMLMMC